MEPVLIGVDLGGTNTRMGVITPDGKILRRIQYPTGASKGVPMMLDELVFRLQDLIQQTPEKNHSKIRVGIGVPGPVDLNRGILIAPPNLPELHQFPLREFLGRRIPFPLVLENDANAFTLGEGWVGAARDARHYCGITLGTGVGGGVVINGEMLRGVDGFGGEVGHMVLNPDGPICGCGGRGCLEVYASGTGVRRMALEAIEREGKPTLLTEEFKDYRDLTSEDVFKAAERGDELAQKVFQEMGRYLGLGLVNLTNLFNPEKIVIGGKVSGAWDYFISQAREILYRRAMKGQRERVEVVRAECGDDAGLLGAAYVALKMG